MMFPFMGLDIHCRAMSVEVVGKLVTVSGSLGLFPFLYADVFLTLLLPWASKTSPTGSLRHEQSARRPGDDHQHLGRVQDGLTDRPERHAGKAAASMAADDDELGFFAYLE